MPVLVMLLGLYVALGLAVAGLLHVMTSPDAIAAAFVPDASTASESGASRWPATFSVAGPRRVDAPGQPTARTHQDNDSRRQR